VLIKIGLSLSTCFAVAENFKALENSSCNGKAEKSLIIEGFPERTWVVYFWYFLPALHTPSLSFIYLK